MNESTEQTITCEAFKARAIKAVEESDAHMAMAMAKFKLESAEKAYQQLKAKFPLLRQEGDKLILCGYSFSARITGIGPNSESYSLVSRDGYFIYDEASFGRFLLREEEEARRRSAHSEESKGFFARFFGL